MADLQARTKLTTHAVVARGEEPSVVLAYASGFALCYAVKAEIIYFLVKHGGWYKTSTMFKVLRPVLEGFDFTMHVGACETGSQTASGFDVLFAQAQVHCDNKPRHISLDPNYNMTCFISAHEC